MVKQPDGTAKKVRSSEYGIGDRRQVRWRDESGSRRKRNFAKKAGQDANTCAEAFDAQITNELDLGTYVDPKCSATTSPRCSWSGACPSRPWPTSSGTPDPGFTLRTYTHLMPSSEDRMRQVIEDAWATGRCALDVP